MHAAFAKHVGAVRDLSRLQRYAEFEKEGALVYSKTVVGFSTAPISTYIKDV